MNLPQIKDHEFLELIGEGSCGFVYRCRSRKGEERAVKVLKALAINRALVRAGLTTVSEVQPNENLVPIHQLQLEETPSYYMMDLFGQPDATGGWKAKTLEQLMGAVTTDVAMGLIDRMADGLAHLHRLEVVHAGFKPSNVFIVEDAAGALSLRITDWGQGYVGGLHYMDLGDAGFYASLEQLETGDFSQGRGKRWDVYAFGVVAYRLLTGRLPRLESQYLSYLNERQERLQSGAVYTTVLEQPGQYVEWIRAQPDVHWPTEPSSPAEEDLRKVISRCLLLDPRQRFADMREVANECATQEREATVRRMERRFVQDEAAIQRRLNRWRVAAVVSLVLLLASAAAAFVMKGLWRDSSVALQDLEAEREAVQKQAKADMLAVLEEQATALDSATRAVDEERLAARKARSILQQAQGNGDRLFELILERPDSDIPGYREERRRRLLEAQTYYEGLVEVYANHPDFVRQSALGYRFLGEIYRESGEVKRALHAYRESAQRFAGLRRDGESSADSLVQLCKVQQAVAELAVALGAGLPEASAALKTAKEFWRQLAAVEGYARMAGLMQARLHVLEAEVTARSGLAQRALDELQVAADLLTSLLETHPGDDAILGLLGRTFSDMGDLVADGPASEESKPLLERSQALLEEALRRNGAVLEHQYQYATCLARLGRFDQSSEQLQDAVAILERIRQESPGERRAAIRLADCYNALAEMQRDGGKTQEAIALETRAVELLRGEAQGAEAARRLERATALGRSLCHLAALSGDADNYEESATHAKEVITLLEGLPAPASENATVRALLAQAEGLAGYAGERTGDKSAARERYESALARWKTLAESDPENAIAKEGLEWASRQLDALEP